MALPIDLIIIEILNKLPSKSLIRSKCVCKSFNTTISSMKFVTHYLQPCLSSPNVNRSLILPTKNDQLYSYNFNSLESSIVTNIVLPPAFDRITGFVTLSGSCNGLLCVSKGFASTRHFILLNPSTGSYWEIPPFVRLSSKVILNFGFGYDAQKGDYKIVTFVEYSSENGEKMRGVMIFSLKGSSWRWVEVGIKAEDSMDRSNSVVLLGYNLLHCVFTCVPRHKKRIGCFDISSETWRDDVRMPESNYDGIEAYMIDVGVLDGCLYSTFENRLESSFDVWIMKDYGVYESWMRLFSIPIINVTRRFYPVAYRRGSNDEILLRVNYPHKLLWYNLSCDGIVEAEFDQVRDLSETRAWLCIDGNRDGDQAI